MSLHSYLVSQAISAADLPFYSLIFAAMRKADDDNLARLMNAFPEQWKELKARHDAPGGVLTSDPDCTLGLLVGEKPRYKIELKTK